MNIPTAHSTESLERFLQHIQIAPPPKLVTRSYLKTSGFTSGNDPELRHIFRLLGFLNNKDEPQALWLQYKERGNIILQEAVYECYKPLFELFPDAPLAHNEVLENWFKPPLTGETRSSIERAIRTFRKLCQFAGVIPDNRVREAGSSQQSLQSEDRSHTLKPKVDSPPLILNVPAFTDKSDYIRYFEALKEVFYE